MYPSSSCTLEMKAARSFETPVFIYQTTLHHITEETILIFITMETSNLTK